jgi:hypothetical protein
MKKTTIPIDDTGNFKNNLGFKIYFQILKNLELKKIWGYKTNQIKV